MQVQRWMRAALGLTSWLAIGVASTLGSSARAVTLERVCAIVEDEIVLESEVRARAATHRDLPFGEARARAITELIDAVVVAKAAAARELVVAASDIDRAVDEIRAQNKLDAAAFEAALRTAGFDMAAYRRTVGEQILQLRLFHHLASSSLALPADASLEVQQRAAEAWLAEQRAESYIARLPYPLERGATLAGDNDRVADRTIQEITVIGEPIKLALPSTLVPGTKTDPALIARAARSVWATGQLADLSFELDDKGVLLVVAKPLPVFHEMILNGEPPSAASIRRLGVVPGTPINPARLHAALRQWRRDQQRLGYYAIEVQETLRPASKDAVDIVVTVKKGTLATVDVRITGNRVLDKKTLTEALVYSPRELLDPAYLEFQVRALQMLYTDRGFVRAEVRGVLEPSADRRRVTATFVIKQEGARHTVGPITLLGDALEPNALENEPVREGAVFNRGELLETITRVQRRLDAAGRGYVAIDFYPQQIAGEKIALTLRAITGLPAPRFGAISVLGQPSGACRPSAIASALEVWNNEAFSTAAMTTIRSTVERSCKIVAHTRNTAIDAREVELRYLVTHR